MVFSPSQYTHLSWYLMALRSIVFYSYVILSSCILGRPCVPCIVFLFFLVPFALIHRFGSIEAHIRRTKVREEWGAHSSQKSVGNHIASIIQSIKSNFLFHSFFLLRLSSFFRRLAVKRNIHNLLDGSVDLISLAFTFRRRGNSLCLISNDLLLRPQCILGSHTCLLGRNS